MHWKKNQDNFGDSHHNLEIANSRNMIARLGNFEVVVTVTEITEFASRGFPERIACL
jgi:hypothetical protein